VSFPVRAPPFLRRVPAIPARRDFAQLLFSKYLNTIASRSLSADRHCLVPAAATIVPIGIGFVWRSESFHMRLLFPALAAKFHCSARPPRHNEPCGIASRKNGFWTERSACRGMMKTPGDFLCQFRVGTAAAPPNRPDGCDARRRLNACSDWLAGFPHQPHVVVIIYPYMATEDERDNFQRGKYQGSNIRSGFHMKRYC